MRLVDKKINLVNALRAKFGNLVTRQQVIEYVNTNKMTMPFWMLNNKSFKAARGTIDLNKIVFPKTSSTAVAASSKTVNSNDGTANTPGSSSESVEEIADPTMAFRA